MPKVNTKATRKAVEQALETYRDYLVTLPVTSMPTITTSYSIIPPTNTNTFSSKTEDAAIERADYEMARNQYMEQIHQAVNSLKHDERYIIFHKYMQDIKGYDPDIWLELGISKTKYYELTFKAMLRLAFSLKIEVYMKRNEVRSA
ncbi:ArpU family transcriptional regulator [Fictibacillus aquaticus]|uniref:ArpU family transcriptional regulator n=2 Tax=Fictibacillus aquaticus TaxID=2021314 RepID=A0A235FBA3_9BACL|nr:ArpU family transcriptional regulator [Fictibacillus aquaticus]